MNAIDDALLDELGSTFEAVAAQSEVSVFRIRSERRVFLPGRIFAWWRGGSKVHRAPTR
jgi:enoyl-CoA hydratase/carnithine racemase